jgi:hypothetical protein
MKIIHVSKDYSSKECEKSLNNINGFGIIRGHR